MPPAGSIPAKSAEASAKSPNGAGVKTAFRRLRGRKNAPTAEDALNAEALPFGDSRGVPLSLADRGSECGGNREHAPYLA